MKNRTVKLMKGKKMNNTSIKRFIACFLLLTGIASMLTAYASSIDDHQGVSIIIGEAVLQGPHAIPTDDPMYSPEYSRNCHRVLYTRTFKCACHGIASDIVTKYFPHNADWVYSSTEHADIGCCKECGQNLKRNHQHVWNSNGFTVVSPRLTVYRYKCKCGATKSKEVYK